MGDASLVKDRIAFIAALPMIAWMQLEQSPAGLGSIVHIVAAEALAALEGHTDLRAVRDRAKSLLLRTAPAAEALGDDFSIWEAIREKILIRREKHMLMAAIGPIEFFNEQRTIGEIATGTIRSRDRANQGMTRLRENLEHEIAIHGDERIASPGRMAEAFYADMAGLVLPPDLSAREMIVAFLCAQGLDADEIQDDLVLADLSDLAMFRKRLYLVAQFTGTDFELLKRLPPTCFPHRVIDRALQRHGQKRIRRRGSDVNDGYLAALAAYGDRTYVDKRTAEDFRQASRRCRELPMLINSVLKVKDYEKSFVEH